jgi:branched-chain amino acid transport system ATP-binding protein
MLSIEGIHASYGGLKALVNVSVKVGEGQFVAIVGPNGAGKSTLFKSISGTVHAHKGQILWGGENILTMKASHRALLGIAHVPEGRQVFKELSVYENLEVGAQSPKALAEASRNLEQIYTLFPILKERSSQLAGTLSGGEQQMLAIGRGLMSAPKLLMLDEPSMGLAPKITDIIFERIQEIHRDTKIAILLVEQRVAEALSPCDYGYVLRSGQVAMEGSPDKLTHGDDMREAYLGM